MRPNHSSSGIDILPQVSVHSTHSSVSLPDLRILHFNDVYNVAGAAKEPVGGIARFQSRVNHYRDGEDFYGQPKLLTLFSGDGYNPSLESIFTKGRHMVEALNRIGVDFACVGNHDLDFGVAHFQQLAKDCEFPWLIANVLDPALGDTVSLGNCQKTAMMVLNGIKIGLIGLVEREWLPTVNQLPPNLIYKSASATALELIPELKKQGADLIIALTHQREPNDVKLAQKTSGLIDLILAGHDHFYKHHVVNGTHIVRSGSDFKQLSYLELREGRVPSQRPWDIRVIREDITGSIPEDPIAADWADSLALSLRPQLDQPVGWTAVELDARFTTVRRQESNMGNFVADLMRWYYHADCCIMAAGTIRGDQVYPSGLLTLKDIRECYPFEDPCVVLSVTGEKIQDALENAVSLYPALEGRFPQVSNISFDLNPSRSPNSRLTSIRIGEEALNPTAIYRLATRDYMARGKDGFTSLLATSAGGAAKEIVSADDGLRIYELVLRYFTAPEEFADISAVNPSFCGYLGPNVVTAPPPSSSSSTHLSSGSTSAAFSPPISPSSSHGFTISSKSSDFSEEADDLSTPLTPLDDDYFEGLGVYGTYPSSKEGEEEEVRNEWSHLRWISPKVEGRIRIIGTDIGIGNWH